MSSRRRHFTTIGCMDESVTSNTFCHSQCVASYHLIDQSIGRRCPTSTFVIFHGFSLLPGDLPSQCLQRCHVAASSVITCPKYRSLRDLMWFSSSFSVPAILKTCAVVINFVHGILNNFLVDLFSKAWIRLSSCFLSVQASHPCVATGQTKALINRSLVMVLTDLLSRVLSAWSLQPCP